MYTGIKRVTKRVLFFSELSEPFQVSIIRVKKPPQTYKTNNRFVVIHSHSLQFGLTAADGVNIYSKCCAPKNCDIQNGHLKRQLGLRGSPKKYFREKTNNRKSKNMDHICLLELSASRMPGRRL